jgi:hypothetical protein
MLGLGLAFTKGMFGKLSSKLSVPEPDIPATADDRIVLPSEELSITKNKEFIFSVNVYNDNFIGRVQGALHCDPKDAAGPIDATSSPQEIPAGEDKGFKFIVPKEQVTQTSTRICTLSFVGDGEGSGTESKQIVISIK